MIGDTVKALRRAREDAAALALKLAELQAGEVKKFKAAASEMRTHVDLLWSEVQVTSKLCTAISVLVICRERQILI